MSTDIEKYHKGLLSPAEMHELEEAALEDPFLADALEGYGGTTTNVESDLEDLEKKLQARIGAKVISLEARRGQLKWWRVAAAVVLIGGVGLATFRLSTNRREKSLADALPKKENLPISTVVGDSNKSAPSDSTAVAATNIGNDAKTNTTVKKSSAVNRVNKVNESDKERQSEVTVGVGAPKHNEGKGDSVRNAKNEETIAASQQAKAAEPAQQGLFADKGSVIKDQERMNYFRGRIFDKSNNPLPFANVTNTRDNVGTYADAQGNFTLISPDSVLNVQIRSVGFENNLAELKKNVASNKIIMQEDKAAPDRILSMKKVAGRPSPMDNMKFEEPEPADGWTNYNTYLANNISIPDELKTKGSHAHVELSFDVNQNGEPVEIKVEKSLCQRCDEEAVRLIKDGPKWKKKTKKAGRVTVTVPFDAEH